MRRAGLILLRVALLPVVVAAGFVLYGQALGTVAPRLMPLPGTGGLTVAVLIAQGFLAATLTAGLLCYPLARLYGRAATGVAVLITLPVLAISVHGAEPAANPVSRWLHAWALASLVILLVGGTWLTRLRLARRATDPSAG